ncbi:MAG: hypothetical protein JWO78_1483 [Micavibrio sp.]|nr:hypothetical protein [Micavibrio sp.]
MAVTPQILTGKVMHKRLFPKVNGFTYGIYNIVMPLAGLEDAVIAIDRPAPLSFYRRDHGSRQSVDLAGWAQEYLQARGIAADGEITLMTLPRVLGYVFNPVSFWFCHDRQGALRAVICEVNNTFGETHSYICAHDDRRALSSDDWLGGKKLFHVSPFLPREGSYRFRFALKDNAIGVWIDHYTGDGRLQLATAITGQLEPMTRAALRRVFWRYPAVTLKAIMLIHWQAVRLLAMGIRYIPKPGPGDSKSSQARDITKM